MEMVELFAANVRLVVVAMFHAVAIPLSVHVPLPIFRLRVPVPVPLNPPLAVSVTLLLLTLKSRMQPVVDAVQAPKVIDCTATVVLTVIVQVTPPTQVAASKVTVSAEPGTDAPVAPPVDADHIAVLAPSHVQVTVQTPNRDAASAGQT